MKTYTIFQMKQRLYLLIFLLTPVLAFAQSNYDICKYAIDLGMTSDYCSGISEFTNIDATKSDIPVPACWLNDSGNDVWFSFSPSAPAAYLKITGSTLKRPQIAIYSGLCNNLTELACDSKENTDLTEITMNDLTIGEIYYLRIDARNNQLGSFQICIKSYSPVPNPESDCVDAVTLCDKSPFQIENLDNVGKEKKELTGDCVGVGQNAEKASVWYRWTCDQAGTLTFTLTPNNPNSKEEDLDFVVYEFPGGLEDCANRKSVRCMLSGETQNGPNNSPCYGPTGLREGETDVNEKAGCNNGSNNFLAPLDMEAGKSYGIIVNNFSKSGYGFSIEFGGTGTFLGPKPDFEIENIGVLECDKILTFINKSNSATDPIVKYSWNFGADSEPKTANGPGPHSSTYTSIGNKVVALTVESSRGCAVTKLLNYNIEPCCQDTTKLDVAGEATDLVCQTDENGKILGSGSAGSPEYTYSLDNINFKRSPLFVGLKAGNYTLYIQDAKGCKDSIPLVVEQPGPSVVDAGPDITVDLGYTGQADATFYSDNGIDTIIWSPLDTFLTCTNCLDPEILPPGSTTYYVTVIDKNGCATKDSMRFIVREKRPIYIPNIFSPNNDGRNEFFNVFGGRAVKRIQALVIFDRWGNKMYEGTPKASDPQDGWNGRFNGRYVDPGVYTWMANVEFVDRKVITYSGTVTLTR